MPSARISQIVTPLALNSRIEEPGSSARGLLRVRAVRKEVMTMLRITTTNDATLITFKLEGRIAGPWVDELRNCWEKLPVESSSRAIRVDLREVTFVDADGKQLLAAMHRQGAELIASGCLMKAVVSEIQQGVV
jgi:anti-anti-sigma regulatory factor